MHGRFIGSARGGCRRDKRLCIRCASIPSWQEDLSQPGWTLLHTPQIRFHWQRRRIDCDNRTQACNAGLHFLFIVWWQSQRLLTYSIAHWMHRLCRCDHLRQSRPIDQTKSLGVEQPADLVDLDCLENTGILVGPEECSLGSLRKVPRARTEPKLRTLGKNQ